MSAYHLDDERAIRTGRLVNDWTQSGLLTPEQRDIVLPQLAVELRRTNLFLRITLFIFGAMILQSALGLIAIFVGDLVDESGAAVLCMLVGGAAFWAASQLVSRYNLYRFGVEEAVALSAVGLVAVGAALFVGGRSDWPLVTGVAVAGVMLTVLYLHFGYVYAAILAMIAGAALPFILGPATGFAIGESETARRVAAILVLTACAALTRVARAGLGHEHPADALVVIEAVAWLGVYALINLVVSGTLTHVDRSSSLYWITYAGIWLLPIGGLWTAVHRRERPLLLAGLTMALMTLLSNKTYLGSPRYEWDPIVFGVLLMAVAIGLRRWLVSGPVGQRHGYTASRLVASDQAHLANLALISAAQVNPSAAPPATGPDPGVGGGGRSGGAGAGGSY